VEHALLELGIRHHFSKVITRNDVRFAKPHPEGWSLLGGGTPRAQYLFVGDSSNDEGAAEALGLITANPGTAANRKAYCYFAFRQRGTYSPDH
jgi:FMN phosphatase YigB (HAD superfamily)